MQRLTWKTDREHGAVAVIVALLMVPLLGFAAIALDIAAMLSDQQRLQVAADASALAIAQDCSRHNCGTPAQTASSLTAANFGAGANSIVSLDTTAGKVIVTTSTVAKHFFARVLGVDSNGVEAQASARWGPPSGGVSILPLTFSWCEFAAQTGGGVPSQTTERIIRFTSSSGMTQCTGPSNLVVPGGFGWVDPPPGGGCMLTSTISQILTSSTGTSVPSTCSATTFQAAVGKILLVPVFDQYTGTGNNASYRVYGYAAFRLTGYGFPSMNYNAPECTGNVRCVKGYFTQFVDLDHAVDFSATAPDLGAEWVTLTS